MKVRRSSGPFLRSGEEVQKIMSDEKREPARKFTEEEMRIARETNLPELLASLGYDVRKVGRFYTTKEMDSLRSGDGRTWFRYSTRQHGDSITFLREFQGMSFPEAVNYLLAFNGHSRDSPIAVRPRVTHINIGDISRQGEKAEFQLPVACEDQRRVFAYLMRRGIDRQVIRSFIDQKLLFEDALHHNCVFVGRNSDGKPVFARGTRSVPTRESGIVHMGRF